VHDRQKENLQRAQELPRLEKMKKPPPLGVLIKSTLIGFAISRRSFLMTYWMPS